MAGVHAARGIAPGVVGASGFRSRGRYSRPWRWPGLVLVAKPLRGNVAASKNDPNKPNPAVSGNGVWFCLVKTSKSRFQGGGVSMRF